MRSNELAVYIHFPFCTEKCRYCAFATFPNQENLIPRYLDGLKREMEYYQPLLTNRQVTTLYLGGGTPSLVETRLLESLLNDLKQKFQLSELVEITLEANPESVTEGKLRAWRQMGINRLSLGLQAWQNPLLKYLGRRYTHELYEERFYQAREAGFDNINVDVIFGIPIQTMDEWQETIAEVIRLQPNHIASYSLESDNESAFGSWKRAGIWREKSPEKDRQEYQWAKEALKVAGYKHYEISNFSQTDKECRHNLSIWKGGEYLGLGASSVSFIQGVSFANHDLLRDYLKMAQQRKFGREKRERFKHQALMKRQLLLNLRLVEGFPLKTIEDVYQMDIHGRSSKTLDLMARQGLLTLDRDWVRLTELGLNVVDGITAEFMNLL